MPVYNGERFIEMAIESILGQSFADFELIICDNCSVDATRQICERYLTIDKRVRYHRNITNVGAPANYNVAFRLGSGRYFKWAASGDVCGAGLFERCIQALESNPQAVLAFPRTRLFEDVPEQFSEYDDRINIEHESGCDRFCALLDNLRLNNAMNGVIRTSTLSRTKPYGRFSASDVVLLAELALRGKFVQVEGAYFYRRMAPETTAGMRSSRELLTHLAPEMKSPIRYPEWRFWLGMCNAIGRARPGFAATSCAAWSVLRRIVWSRRELWSELWSH